MFKKSRKRKIITAMAILTGFLPAIGSTIQANAMSGYGITMGPMDEQILLNPGDSYTSTFTLSESTDYDTPLDYSLEVVGYSIDGEECGSYCKLTDWVIIDSPLSGEITPGESTDVFFTINVPSDAPGGGQYASIAVEFEGHVDNVQEDNESNEGADGDSTASIIEKKQIVHVIYAEITGNIIHSGNIIEANIPSLILSGNISGTATVENTGNVHSDATYKLQVFPLFSDEEIYTNEENPQTRLVLPDKTLINNTTWENTPDIGIYNVKYTVEFEGSATTIEKLVIKCPLWLLFVIIFAVILLILWIVAKSKSRKKSAK